MKNKYVSLNIKHEKVLGESLIWVRDLIYDQNNRVFLKYMICLKFLEEKSSPTN